MIQKEGRDLLIGFNPKFLIDVLRVVDDEEVHIYLVNPKAPCFIKDDAGSYNYLVLPVNFNHQKGKLMKEIKIKDEYIKLGQALKAAGLVSSGLEAKIVIQDGEVSVNGEIETRRGKKLFGGERVSFGNEELQILKQLGVL